MTTDWLTAGSLVFFRVTGFLTIFPLLSAAAVPKTVRVGLGMLLTWLISAALPEMTWEGLSLGGWLGLAALEMGVGLVMGFVCRFLFYALELAGALISMEMGLNLPAAFNPISQGPSTLPAAVLNQLAIIIWLTLDLHHWLLAGFQRSFAILPVGVARFGEAALIRMTGGVGDLFVVAMQLAAPILAVSFIISLVFALLGRAVPQMPVFSESFAVRLMAGLGVFGVSMQLFATQISQHLRQLPEDMLQLVNLLQG